MNKTLTLNIGGIVFHAEEEAYNRLKNYLDKLHAYFFSQPDGKEIVSDIEVRIAELLSEKRYDDQQVVTLKMIDEVITTLGQPEDFSENEDTDYTEANSRKESQETYNTSNIPSIKPRRKLFRDPSNKMIGGVCAGLSVYFNIDIVAMRIIFIVLLMITAGNFGFIYIVLWIAVPEAISVSQRLEMQGEPVNVNNIGKEFNDLKNNAKAHYDKFQSKVHSGTRQTRSPHPPRPPKPPKPPYANKNGGFGDFILGIFKIFFIFIGSIFLVTLAISVFALIGVIFGASFPDTIADIWNLNLGEFPSELARTSARATTGLALCIGIPIFLLVFFISKLAFKHQGKTGWVLFLSFILWFSGFIMIGSAVINFVDKHGLPENWERHWEENLDVKIDIHKKNNHYKNETSYPLSINSDTLYIELSYHDTIAKLRKAKNYIIEGNITFYKPDISILPTQGDLKMDVIGYSEERWDATKRIYNWKLQGDTIFIPYFYFIEDKQKHGSSLKFKLRIPEGTTIYLIEGNGMENFNSVAFDGEQHLLKEMSNQYWFMTEKGLKHKTN